MTHALLVCRMGSSRLPGKTLRPFGARSLLGHIAHRIGLAGIAPERVVICTSSNAEDDAIEAAAADLGCDLHRGPADDVSGRILGAAEARELEGFVLLLGDNPWLDPAQMAAVADRGAAGAHDYLVTATGELPRAAWPARMAPIGTRVQWIRTALMAERLAALRSAETEEHTSKLFATLPEGTRAEVMTFDDGLPPETVGTLNVSINTAADYERALGVLERLGPEAPIAEVTGAYLTDGGAA